MLAVRQDLNPVDEHVQDAGRQLVWLGEGGAILNRLWIEHYDIGETPRLQSAALLETQILCR